jgi:hypothetical protein
MEVIEMEICITDKVKKLLEERGIKREDVKEVIEHGESTRRRFYMPEEKRFLGKKRIGNVTVNVEYSADGTVHTAYTHRAKLLENTSKPMVTELGGKVDVYGEGTEQKRDETVGTQKLGVPWSCSKCNEKAVPANTEVTFMNIQRSIYSMACPKCGLVILEEPTAVGTLAAAEGLLEAKGA